MKENWKNNPSQWLLLLALPLVLLLAGCKKGDSHGHAEGEVYTCPMHPDVVQDGPGTCPVCKMDLVKRETATAAAESGPEPHQHAGGEVYTCPMHPDVKQEEPGSCPVCKMDLVKQGGAGGTDAAAVELGDLLRPVNQAVISSIETVHPESGAKRVTVELPGTVEYDTRRINAISSRFAGRIEKLYVRYNYQPVRKGQKLLEVYSPQLVEAQQELIFLLTQDAANTRLIEGARRKLGLLGLSAGQINAVAATRKPQYKIAVYSPYNGYVVENLPAGNAVAGTATPPAPPAGGGMSSGAGMGGMSGGGTAPAPQAAPTNAQAGTTLSVTEGGYVTAGQPVFRVVNTDRVWAVFGAYAGTAGRIGKGQPVEIIPESNPGQVIRGRVELVEPFYRSGGNTATLRVPLSNPGGWLRSGMLLTGKMTTETDTGLWLPREAVLDLGNRQVVFVRKGNSLTPVAIRAGIGQADQVQVLSGLSPGDAVARNAQFLVDNEAFVRIQE